MNYELAKELKNAGFPQKGQGSLVEHCNCGSTQWMDAPHPLMGTGGLVHQPDTDCLLYAPTLSELIETCGYSFKVLRRLDGQRGWAAISEFRAPLLRVVGNTPEIAVARLWLALNKP